MLAIASLFKSVREMVLKPVGRGIRWLTTIRLTTTGRKAAKASEVADLLRRLEAAQEATAAAVAAGRAEVDAVKAQAASVAEERERGFWAEMANAHNESHEKGREQALAEVAAGRAVPLIRPTWRVNVQSAAAHVYDLENVQLGSFATDVSIAASSDEFDFEGPNQWAGEFPYSVRFFGAPTRSGRRKGVDIVVRWRDENGDPQEGKARIDSAPRQAVFL